MKSRAHRRALAEILRLESRIRVLERELCPVVIAYRHGFEQGHAEAGRQLAHILRTRP